LFNQILWLKNYDVHQVGHFDLQLKELTLVAGCLTSSDMVFKAIPIAIGFNLKVKLFFNLSNQILWLKKFKFDVHHVGHFDLQLV